MFSSLRSRYSQENVIFFTDPANENRRNTPAPAGLSTKGVAHLARIDKALNDRNITKELLRTLHEFRDITKREKEVSRKITQHSDRTSFSDELDKSYIELRALREESLDHIMKLIASLSDETLLKIANFIKEEFVGTDDDQPK